MRKEQFVSKRVLRWATLTSVTSQEVNDERSATGQWAQRTPHPSSNAGAFGRQPVGLLTAIPETPRTTKGEDRGSTPPGARYKGRTLLFHAVSGAGYAAIAPETNAFGQHEGHRGSHFRSLTPRTQHPDRPARASSDPPFRNALWGAGYRGRRRNDQDAQPVASFSAAGVLEAGTAAGQDAAAGIAASVNGSRQRGRKSSQVQLCELNQRRIHDA